VRHQGHTRGEAEVFLSPPPEGGLDLVTDRQGGGFWLGAPKETEQRRALFNAETDAEET